MKDYTKQNKEHLKEIKQFLNDNKVDYKIENNNTFVLNYNNNERNYEISYVPSHLHPMTYEKYGIEGVSPDYFYKLSHKAEHEDNSFKCWVKDYEWADDRKREVLKSYFLHAAQKTKKRFYARDCEVKEVKTKEGRTFESLNCFYGKRGASLSLGLYLKKDKHGEKAGTLVMIYTFGKNFFGKDNSIEILRVGTLKFSQVIGGSSKLLKYFMNNYPTMLIGKNEVPVEKLKFYSDYDHNLGGSMKELGFDFINYSKGGFMNYWVETGEVKGRQPNKHKWVMEQMSEGKVFAIPNAGVKTYILNAIRERVKKLSKEYKKQYIDIVNKLKIEQDIEDMNDDEYKLIIKSFKNLKLKITYI